jgi:proliferating cell nuclear antigen
MFKIKHADASKIKRIFEVLQKFSVEIEFVCNQDGISIIGIDSTHVCFFNMFLTPQFFQEYNVKKECMLSLSLIDFIKILRLHGPKDGVSLQYENGRSLNISMFNESKKGARNIKFNLYEPLNIYKGNKKASDALDEIRMDNRFKIDPLLLEDTINAASIISDSVVFRIRKGSVTFLSEGSLGSIEDIVDVDDLEDVIVKEEFDWSFTISHLKNIISSKTFSEKMSIELSVNKSDSGKKEASPMRVDFDLGNESKLRFYLAPRVDEDKDEYDSYNESVSDNESIESDEEEYEEESEEDDDEYDDEDDE